VVVGVDPALLGERVAGSVPLGAPLGGHPHRRSTNALWRVEVARRLAEWPAATTAYNLISYNRLQPSQEADVTVAGLRAP
jgi:hypothetical protein